MKIPVHPDLCPKKTSTLGLIIAILILCLISPVGLSAGNSGKLPIVEIKNVDDDGLSDASIETTNLRLVISSKTGNFSFYYLKGANFEESIFPPELYKWGYSFASDTFSPFEIIIGKTAAELEKSPQQSFIIRQEDAKDDSIVISAAQNLPPGEISILRRYIFHPKGYSFETETIISNFGSKDIVIGNAQLGTPGLILKYGPGIFLDPFDQPSFLALKPDSPETFQTYDAFKKAVLTPGFTGAGLKTTYFCLLMDAKSPVQLSGREFEVKSDDPKKKLFKGGTVELSVPPFSIKPKESKSFSFHNYLGPKLLDELSVIHREQVTDYGFLSTMLLRVLQFFTAIYPNFGLSIVFLTLVVRLVLYPLTVSQTRSMAKMQKIQPLVQDIKDRYKEDPQKFNEEVLKLYQKHQVNPLGGCLPLFLQLPVLIALYNTINIAVELRKMPFLWMPDLSKADPYLILPIAIAALMYYQQGKISDPQQQQMMSFMPMFMFVITWSLPSGLLIYWFTSSIIGLIQQIQAEHITSAIKEE